MRVLVACEESATVRMAFERVGHDAWSCDLLPSRVQGKHIQALNSIKRRLGYDDRSPTVYVSFGYGRKVVVC